MSTPTFSIYDFSLMGLTESQLLSIRDSALSNMTTTLVNGKVVSSVNAPGLTTTFQVYATPMQILKGVTYALQLINPTLYGVPVQNQVIGYNR